MPLPLIRLMGGGLLKPKDPKIGVDVAGTTGGRVVGFGSYDLRQRPALGIVGHNCILPEFRGRGFGKEQILEILRRFRIQGIRKAKTSTGARPFFHPAQRMYIACGFQETGRVPCDADPSQDVIEYEMELVNKPLHGTR